VLFQLPESTATEDSNTKENQHTNHGLPYRSIFAVLTWDSVVIFDTYHTKPLATIRGLHYCHLVDATWTSDGRNLIVCSTDGYVSIIRFGPEELGRVYVKPEDPMTPATAITTGTASSTISTKNDPMGSLSSSSVISSPAVRNLKPKLPTPEATLLPPCEPGPVAVANPPAKRAKTLTSSPSPSANYMAVASALSVQNENAEELIGRAVNKLTLSHTSSSNNNNNRDDRPVQGQPPKKKKRIQPMLLSSN